MRTTTPPVLAVTGASLIRGGAQVLHQLTFMVHAGEHLALDRDVEAGRNPIEERRFEHVGAGVDPVARRLARGRLLDEGDDRTVVLGGNDTERARVRDLRERDRGLRPPLDEELH